MPAAQAGWGLVLLLVGYFFVVSIVTVSPPRLPAPLDVLFTVGVGVVMAQLRLPRALRRRPAVIDLTGQSAAAVPASSSAGAVALSITTGTASRTRSRLHGPGPVPEPEVQPGGQRLPRWMRSAGFGSLFVVLATVAQLLRQPGVPSWNTVLAEDGAVFLTDALNHPLGATLLRPYEGYLHVVPRLLAAVASAFPLRYAAALLTGGSAVVVSLLALYVWSRSRSVFCTRWARAVVVAFLLLLPTAGYETNASVNNLHWYLDFACFWDCLARTRHRREVAIAAVIVAAAALCDPLVGVFLPLVAVRAVRRFRQLPRRSTSLLVPVALVAGLALQVGAGLSDRAPRQFVPVSWLDLPGTYGFRVAGSLLVGDRYLVRLFHGYGLVFAYLCLLVAVVAVVVAVLVTRDRVRVQVLVAAGYSVLLFVVPLLLRGTSIYLDRRRIRLDGSRYMIVPALLLVVALVLAVDRPGEHARPSRPPVLRPVLILLVGVLLAVNYSVHSVRAAGPGWGQTVAAAQQRCLRSAGQPGDVGASTNSRWATPVGPGQALLPVAPMVRGSRVSQWNVVVDCRRLT